MMGGKGTGNVWGRHTPCSPAMPTHHSECSEILTGFVLNVLKYLHGVLAVCIGFSLTPSHWPSNYPTFYFPLLIHSPLFIENLQEECSTKCSRFRNGQDMMLATNSAHTFVGKIHLGGGFLPPMSLIHTSVKALKLLQLCFGLVWFLMRVSYLDNLNSWGFSNAQGTNPVLPIFRMLGYQVLHAG